MGLEPTRLTTAEFESAKSAIPSYRLVSETKMEYFFICRRGRIEDVGIEPLFQIPILGCIPLHFILAGETISYDPKRLSYSTPRRLWLVCVAAPHPYYLLGQFLVGSYSTVQTSGFRFHQRIDFFGTSSVQILYNTHI